MSARTVIADTSWMQRTDGSGLGPTTRLWFIWRGRKYTRSYSRILTRRGAVRAAARFAREVARWE